MLLVNVLAAGGSPGVYSLSNLNSSYSDTDFGADTYGVVVWFRTDGTVDVTRTVAADLNDEETYVVPGSQSANTYVRCSYVSGSHLTGGAAEDTWLKLDVQRGFSMSYAASAGPDTISGVFTFELSRNSDGSNVLATKSNVTITVGSL